MQIGTFNGIQIIALPDIHGTGVPHAAFSSVEFSMSNATATVMSPFTGQVQTQQWPMADSWHATCEWPPLTPSQKGLVSAFLSSMRGQQWSFYLGDPTLRTPMGNALADNVTSAHVLMEGIFPPNTNFSGAQGIWSAGWPPFAPNLLLAGDYVQIGVRLHLVLDTVNADSNGHAQINIAPSMREVPNDGDPITFVNPVGLFRMAANTVTWSSNHDGTSSASFRCTELR